MSLRSCSRVRSVAFLLTADATPICSCANPALGKIPASRKIDKNLYAIFVLFQTLIINLCRKIIGSAFVDANSAPGII